MLAPPPIGAANDPAPCAAATPASCPETGERHLDLLKWGAALLDEGADQGAATDQRCKYIGKGAGRWTFAPRISACP